ncbi:MAG TPA: response regulator [Candidatus Mediterraneibacter colneyensis]|nr:response regulator [Candidatus Mediterraneibacter colneyensis]
MFTILIVDDEKLERNGIKFLLKRETEEFKILEAENGKDALGVLASNHVDILFSDVKMPYMNGLELVQQARELYDDMEIVIFSGYNDFTYAREALRYGVVDYVLKPVDPSEFSKTLARVMDNIREREADREQRARQTDYLVKYFLIDHLYTGSAETAGKLEKLLDEGEYVPGRCTRMMLVSAASGFFETEEEHFTGALREQIQREFYYVNLNSNESLFLFTEKYTDYRALAETIHQFFLKQYESDCYFAVSEPISGWRSMPEVFAGLEKLLEEQFYQPNQHVFMSGAADEKTQDSPEEDSELMEQISHDIQHRDIAHLKQDFGKLEKKYRIEKQFSEMYVKFVFSSIMKEVYEQMSNSDEKALSRKVDRLYRCRKISDVLDIVSDAVEEFEKSTKEKEDGFREEVTTVKNYIYHHYNEKDLSAEKLAALVYLSPGYLSAIFKEQTGATLNRFIREVRMGKAKELLENTNKKIAQIAREVGFSNSSYFCRSFREFFGNSPESCRKGLTDEEALQQS